MGSIKWIKPLMKTNDQHVLICHSNACHKDETGLLRCDRRMMKASLVSFSGHHTTHRSGNVPDLDCSERLVVATDTTGTVKTWDIDSGQLLKEFKVCTSSESNTSFNTKCVCKEGSDLADFGVYVSTATDCPYSLEVYAAND
mmetsp:Transcript_10495/g.12042  ORF Transcript_10495/g.12042 Transcript_10495/m.12042 type:complete len:142 (+) Transcript_10495:1-426(+)